MFKYHSTEHKVLLTFESAKRGLPETQKWWIIYVYRMYMLRREDHYAENGTVRAGVCCGGVFHRLHKSGLYNWPHQRGYDVRSSGSKNAGASNTVIMVGKLAGVLVALLDIFKAALSWRLCQALFPQFALAGILGGVACILGHMFPVFLHFCGGKGLACIGGVVLAYDPATFLIMLAITCVIGFATNYIAIATVSIAAIWPVYYGVTTASGPGRLCWPFPLCRYFSAI